MYHLAGSRVWFEDSPRGIADAEDRGCASVDLNMQPNRRRLWYRGRRYKCPLHPDGSTCRGHELDTHWKRPLEHGWVDPEGKMRRGKSVTRMTAEEWMRIHPSGHPDVHIELMEDQIRRLAQHGLNGSLEAKGRAGWSKARMRRLWDACHRFEVPALVKSAYSRPLRRARAVGFQTRYTRDHRRGM